MPRRHAFTIIELLVVVAIIAILIGILLPAIGKARDSAKVTQSMSQLRQLSLSHAIYGSDHNDNQWTPTPHNLTLFGNGNIKAAVEKYNESVGATQDNKWATGIYMGFNTPALEMGFAKGGLYYWVSDIDDFDMITPIHPKSGHGFYGTWNVMSFNRYVNNKVYDRLFYAPKDTHVISTLGSCFDAPGEMCVQPDTTPQDKRSSYMLSAAALFTPDFLSKIDASWNEGLMMPGLFRVPTFSQARYPDLKTHKMEIRWLQRRIRECNLVGAPDGWPIYDNCSPYFFNGGVESMPATLFYDGHTGLTSVLHAIDANSLTVASGTADDSLWHTKALGWNEKGFFHDWAYTPPGVTPDFGSPGNQTTSYHILTRHGILGRDKLSQ